MHTKSQHPNQDRQFVGLDTILEPLAQSLNALNHFLDAQIERFEPELQDLVRYSLQHKGKRIRPMLVFYSAWNSQQEISEDLIKVAGIIELSHLATLVHDDILDEASIRHSTPTIFNDYGSKVAVLLGDALFSHALVLASEFKSGDVCFTIAQSIRRVCAGEIKQTFHASKDTYSFDDYYGIIDLKTAELFYVSCLLGARLGGFPEDYVNAVSSFGRNIGVAYQIYDDLLDILGSENYVGKTLGTDFSSGKHTLPTLILIDKLSACDRLEFLANLKNGTISLEHLKSLLSAHNVFTDVFAILSQKLEDAVCSIGDYKDLPSFSYLIKIQSLVFDQSQRLQDLCFL